MCRSLLQSLIGLLACGVLQACDGARGPASRCELAGLQSAAPADTVLAKAERQESPVPHCLVEGFVTTADPGPNRNNFRLQLPDDFAGPYYFIGLGGSAGALPSDRRRPAGIPSSKASRWPGPTRATRDPTSTGAPSGAIAPRRSTTTIAAGT